MARTFFASRSTERPGNFSLARDGETIAALDGLRAAAIFLVLGRHAVNPYRPIEGDGFGTMFDVFGWDAATPLINGWIGVDLFFVLSGFLISAGIIRRSSTTGSFRFGRYIARRALRILPAYYAMLAIAAAGAIPFYAVGGEMIGIRVIYHALFLQDYLPSNIVVAFWSLGVEEKFYIAAPFVLVPLLALRRRSLQYGVLVLLILTPLAFRLNIAAGDTVVTDYETFFRTLRSPFHRGFDGLAIGVLVAFLWHDRHRVRWLSDRRAIAGIFWTGIGVITWLWLPAPILDRIGSFDRIFLQLVLAAGFGAILLGVLLRHDRGTGVTGVTGSAAGADGIPERLLSLPVLRPVAVLSYSLYLVHMTMIPASQTLTRALLGVEAGNMSASFAVFVPIYLILSVLGALILYCAVEKPFLMLRDAKF
jgi:peptidoglycan/LPS O-acetylase OafA/YrhL